MSKEKPNINLVLADINKDVEAMITRIIDGDAIPLNDVFGIALRSEEYLRVFKDRTAIQASLHIPRAIEAAGRAAATGDLHAAKLLLDVVGITQASGSKFTPNVMTQVNITSEVPRVRDVIEIKGTPND